MRLLAHLFTAVVGTALASCGGSKGPAPHPVGEMRSRAMAKLDLVELVVTDEARAERLRDVYQRLADLGRQFDLARARSMLDARSVLENRPDRTEPPGPTPSAELERVLAPPLEESKAFYDRYSALMLEVRSLLTEDEFEKLNGVR